MKKTFFITIVLLSNIAINFNNLNAQSVYNDTNIDEYITDIHISKVPEGNYVGSPYENDSFQKGTIIKNNIVISHQVGLRYNAHKDLFEIKKNMILTNDQATMLKRSSDITNKLNKKDYLFLPANDFVSRPGYYVVLLKDKKVSLYKKIIKKYVAGQKAYTSLAQDVAPSYKEITTLYMNDEKGEMVLLSNSKKGKLKAFENHKKEVKQYIKENKLNINKENNLVKLIKYYNTL